MRYRKKCFRRRTTAAAKATAVALYAMAVKTAGKPSPTRHTTKIRF